MLRWRSIKARIKVSFEETVPGEIVGSVRQTDGQGCKHVWFRVNGGQKNAVHHDVCEYYLANYALNKYL